MTDGARGPTRTYSNGEIRVIWRADVCIHSGVCVRGLPGVFRPGRRPWIDIGGAPSDRIVAQVEQCPSGALSWQPARPDDDASAERPAGDESGGGAPA
jgi:uncharacterized Fe-S cluster protein YjdI